jgi:hypothetical protein
MVNSSPTTFYGRVISVSGAVVTVEQISSQTTGFTLSGDLTPLGPAPGMSGTAATFNFSQSASDSSALQNVRIESVSTLADYDVLLLGSGSRPAVGPLFVTNCVFNNINNTFANVQGAVGGFWVDNCYVGGLQGVAHTLGSNAALTISLSADVIVNELHWHAIDIESFAQGIVCSNLANGLFADSSFIDIHVDGASNVGAFVLQADGGEIQDIRLADSWLTLNNPSIRNTAGAAALLIDGGPTAGKLTGINISNCRIEGSTGGGTLSPAGPALHITGHAEDITVTGSQLMFGSYGALLDGAGVTSVVLAGNIISAQDDPNSTGIYVHPTSGSINHVVISGNQIAGNTSTGVAGIYVDAGSGASVSDIAITGNTLGGYNSAADAITVTGTFTDVQIANNPGFNPYGLTPTTPGLPTGTGSGNAVANQFPYVCRVFSESSGAANSIPGIVSTSGVATSVGVSSSFILLGPGEKIYYTNEVPTSWTWFGI